MSPKGGSDFVFRPSTRRAIANREVLWSMTSTYLNGYGLSPVFSYTCGFSMEHGGFRRDSSMPVVVGYRPACKAVFLILSLYLFYGCVRFLRYRWMQDV